MVSEGDHVHELYVVLAGLMESFKPGIGETADDIALAVGPDMEGSMHSATSRYGKIQIMTLALSTAYRLFHCP